MIEVRAHVTQPDDMVDGYAYPVADDFVDPDLLTLPPPPQGRRTLALAFLLLVQAASIALAVSLRHEVSYFLSSTDVSDLGEAEDVDLTALPTNATVRLRGMPMSTRIARYRQVVGGRSFAVFPLAGQRAIFVHVRDDPTAITQGDFQGRLVPLDAFGGRGRVIEAELRRLGFTVSGRSLLLVQGQRPDNAMWAFIVALLCALVIAVDLTLLIRWFRPIRAREPHAEASAPT